MQKFSEGVPYVLVNFRDSGHSGVGNAPALDTGTEGMGQIIEAVRSRLGNDVQIVPIGGFPAGETAETWGDRPHLVNYWTWNWGDGVPNDRRSQLGLLHYLKNRCNIRGAIGMRSGVTDQFTLAGIKTISIDITPYQNQRDLAGGGMLNHPSKGWDRGMKMERVFGPKYGRVFLGDARAADTETTGADWAGAFTGADEQTIADAISFYLGEPGSMYEEESGIASQAAYQHRSHPMHDRAIERWMSAADAEDVSVERKAMVLQQIRDQLKAARRTIQDPVVKKRFDRACRAYIG